MNQLGKELIDSLAEALAHAQRQPAPVRVHHIETSPQQSQAARKALGLSQVTRPT